MDTGPECDVKMHFTILNEDGGVSCLDTKKSVTLMTEVYVL